MITTGEAVWQERLEIVGTKGRMLLEDDVLHVYRYSKDSKEYMDTEAVNSRDNLAIMEEVIDFGKAKEPYVEMLENFAEAVLTGDSSILIAPGAEAIHQLMLTNAAYFSAWKKAAVTLPLDAGEYEKAFAEACRQEKNGI